MLGKLDATVTDPYEHLRSILSDMSPSAILREVAPRLHGRAQLILLVAAWQPGSREIWAERLDLSDQAMLGMIGACLVALHSTGSTIITDDLRPNHERYKNDNHTDS